VRTVEIDGEDGLTYLFDLRVQRALPEGDESLPLESLKHIIEDESEDGSIASYGAALMHPNFWGGIPEMMAVYLMTNIVVQVGKVKRSSSGSHAFFPLLQIAASSVDMTTYPQDEILRLHQNITNIVTTIVTSLSSCNALQHHYDHCNTNAPGEASFARPGCPRRRRVGLGLRSTDQRRAVVGRVSL
jgi:hypothetical protein